MIRSISGALAHKRSELGQKEKGFTLIELLVVVIIIGILAAIAIPIFLSQQLQAKDAAAKADLANVKVSYVSYLVDNPTGISTTLPADFTKSSDTVSVTIKTGGTSFCIEAVSGSAATNIFKITNAGGVVKASCP